MKLPINKDFDKEYKDDFMKGFSMREVFFLALAIATVGIIFFLLYQFLDLSTDILIYISLPFGFLVASPGFWRSKSGLSLWEYIKAKDYIDATWHLTYQSTEFDPYNVKNSSHTKGGKDAKR